MQRENLILGLLAVLAMCFCLAARPMPEPDSRTAVVYTAKTQLGNTYTRGGGGPVRGFDCSGFTHWVFENHNIDIPRQSGEQFALGTRVDKDELRPGDLVFFSRGKHRIGHVGIYVGNNRFIHSPRPGKPVEEDSLSAAYWSKHYVGARSVIKTAPRVSPVTPAPEPVDSTLASKSFNAAEADGTYIQE